MISWISNLKTGKAKLYCLEMHSEEATCREKQGNEYHKSQDNGSAAGREGIDD